LRNGKQCRMLSKLWHLLFVNDAAASLNQAATLRPTPQL
jgi:hypothetical protein